MKTVFVTVGTTKFDQLIESITSPENVKVRKCVLNDGTQPFASTNFYFYSYVINMSMCGCMCCISMRQNNRILTRNSNPLKREMYRICSWDKIKPYIQSIFFALLIKKLTLQPHVVFSCSLNFQSSNQGWINVQPNLGSVVNILAITPHNLQTFLKSTFSNCVRPCEHFPVPDSKRSWLWAFGASGGERIISSHCRQLPTHQPGGLSVQKFYSGRHWAFRPGNQPCRWVKRQVTHH